jgi:hypothetical protein
VFEVTPRVGELRVQDIRVALGRRQFFQIEHVDVLVLGRPGESASATRVFLTEAAGGLGSHRRLVCPKCLRSKKLLLTDGAGGLGCARCLGRRTRRQLERTAASWHRYGGRLEDRLFRILSSPAKRGRERALVEADELARQILDGDQNVLSALAPEVRAALEVSELVPPPTRPMKPVRKKGSVNPAVSRQRRRPRRPGPDAGAGRGCFDGRVPVVTSPDAALRRATRCRRTSAR